jgi:hypothetical protein
MPLQRDGGLQEVLPIQHGRVGARAGTASFYKFDKAAWISLAPMRQVSNQND